MGTKKRSTVFAANKDSWKKVKVQPPLPPRKKETITIRIDPEVLSWFRSNGPGYQSFINAVLKAYVEAAREEHD